MKGLIRGCNQVAYACYVVVLLVASLVGCFIAFVMVRWVFHHWQATLIGVGIAALITITARK